jgi:hypothetical protein
MKKTQVAREVADTLHVAEASLEATLADARSALARLKAAKPELGLNGTVGDAAIARWAECVAALEEARAAMIESHQESYRVLKSVNIKTTAEFPLQSLFAEDSGASAKVA